MRLLPLALCLAFDVACGRTQLELDAAVAEDYAQAGRRGISTASGGRGSGATSRTGTTSVRIVSIGGSSTRGSIGGGGTGIGGHSVGGTGDSHGGTNATRSSTAEICPQSVPPEGSMCSLTRQCEYAIYVKPCCTESIRAVCNHGTWGLKENDCDCPTTGGTAGANHAGSASTLGSAAGSSGGGTAGTLGHAGGGAAGDGFGTPIEPIATSNQWPVGHDCPIDRTLPACAVVNDVGVAVARSNDCLTASMEAHGCQAFAWYLGTEWVFLCSPFGGCSWPMTVDEIREYRDYVSIRYTVTEGCATCPAESPSCAAMLLPTTKRVVASGTLVRAVCNE